LDMRWSWDHTTNEVWRQPDPELWKITHNPWVVLQTVSRDRIESILANQAALRPTTFAARHFLWPTRQRTLRCA
jgi:hypothetical protein